MAYLSYRTRFTCFPCLYWVLLELVVSASCAGSTSAIDCPEVSCSWSEGSVTLVFRHDVRYGFLRNPVHVAEVSGAPPNAADEIRVGKSLPDFLPCNAREIGKNLRYLATMLPTDADILRASANDSPNPPAPVDRLAYAHWWGGSIN